MIWVIWRAKLILSDTIIQWFGLVEGAKLILSYTIIQWFGLFEGLN